jgi:hypothetical protein
MEGVMPSVRKPKSGGSDDDDERARSDQPGRDETEGGEGREYRRGRRRQRHEYESFDDPEEHLEIERRRFYGGLPPTPELYARAREQWYGLPGSLVRPSMDPVVAEQAPGEEPPPGQGHAGGPGPER